MTRFFEVTLFLLRLLCSMLEFKNVIILMRGLALGHISHGPRVIVNNDYRCDLCLEFQMWQSVTY